MKKTLLCAALSLFALSGYAQTVTAALDAARTRGNWQAIAPCDNSAATYVGGGRGEKTWSSNGVKTTMYELYRNSTAQKGDVTKFSINVENGNYAVTVLIQNNFTPGRAGITSPSQPGDKGYTRLVANGSAIDLPVTHLTDLDGFTSYTIPAKVTNGTLEVKVEHLKDGGGNWLTWYVTNITKTTGAEVYYQDFEKDMIGWYYTTGAANALIKGGGGDSKFPTNSFENWKGSKMTGKMYTRQIVNNGNYRVSLDVRVNATDNTNIYFYANGVKTVITNTEANTYTADLKVTDGAIEFGVGLDAAVADWFQVDNAKIIDLIFEDGEAALAHADYANVVGNERGELRAAIDSKDVAGAHTAYDAFVAAKASYDAWKKVYDYVTVYNETNFPDALQSYKTAFAEAKAQPSNAADATAKISALQNSLANALKSNALAEGIAGRVDMSNLIVNPQGIVGGKNSIEGWNNIPIDDKHTSYTFEWGNNELPRFGNHGVTNYFDKYDGAGVKYGAVNQQTITVEPGVYRVSAFGRGLEGNGVFQNLNLTAAAGAYANYSLADGCHTETAIANIGNGRDGKPDGQFGHGWNIYYVDVKVPTNQISIGLEQATEFKGAWWGITNYSLVKIGEVSQADKDAYAESNYATIIQKLLANPEYEVVTGDERRDLEAIKDDQTKTAEEFTAAINKFKTAKASYQSLKTAKDALRAALTSCVDASEEAKTASNNALTLEAQNADDAATKAREVYYTRGYLRFCHSHAAGLADAVPATIANPNFLDGMNNWNISGIQYKLKGGEQWKKAWTDNKNYKDKYPDADYIDEWVGEGNYAGTVTQTITLTPGKYRLSGFLRGESYAYTKFNFNATTNSAAFPSVSETFTIPVTPTGGEGGDFGNGWELYSKDITVPTNSLTIAVDINANGSGGKWTSMTGFHLVKLAELTDAEKDAAIAKLPENPGTVLNDAAYANVKGTERNALAAAVAAKDVIALETALPAFKAAKTDYDAYASHKAAIAALDCPDATEALRNAVAALKVEPTTAADAKAKAADAVNTIPSAKRSHALAEGRAARVDKTSAIKNANASDGINGWNQTDIAEYAHVNIFDTPSNQAPNSQWGVTTYFDTNGGRAGNNKYGAELTQEVAVEPGVYRVSMFARGSGSYTFDDFSVIGTPVTTLDANATDLRKTAVANFGNAGGYFNNGWDIYSVDVVVPTNKIKLGARFACGDQNNSKWLSFSNFTLVKIADVTAEEKAAFADKVRPAVNAVLADAKYNNVSGNERKAVVDALASNEVATVETALTTFTGAKGAYDAFVAAKPALDENFADASKTLTDELAALKAGPATAEQATTMTARIPAFVPEARLSHARAEGTRTATVALVNATNPSNIDGWTITDVADYTRLGINTTTGEGPDAKYSLTKYFNNSNVNPGGTFTQNVAVEPGRYRLSAFTRGQGGIEFKEYALVGAPYNADVATSYTKAKAKKNGLHGGIYGNDNGWDVTYVDVVVPTTAMTVGVSVLSDLNENRWFSFGNFTLAKIGDVTAEEIAAYNAQVKGAGDAVLNDPAYVNVTGEEREALVAAIAGTDDAAISNAVAAFKGAKGAYDSYVADKAAIDKFECPDASAEKLAAVDAFKGKDVKATSAADAATKSAAIYAAISNAKVSHALAEGRAARVDKTSAIKNANASDGINGWNKADIANYNAANFTTPNGEAPNTAKWGVDKYFDTNGTNFGAEFTQEVAVGEPGVYRLAAFMRGSGNFVFDDYSLIGTPVTTLDVNATDLQKASIDNAGVRYGNRGGYFGSNVANPTSYGWDIYYLDIVVPTNKVKIGARVAHKNTDSKWLGFSNFTLVKIGDVTAEQKAAFADKVRPAVNAVLADAQYGNVSGGERQAVVDALASNEVATVETALPTFTGAKEAYDNYVNTVARLKTLNYEDASADAKAGVDAVLAAPANAADATTKAGQVSLTYARAKLSHARAEGREGRKVVTLANPDALDGTNGWTTNAINGKKDDCAWDVINGQLPAAEFGMTKYFDMNGNGRGREMLQQVSVEPGVYRVAAFMRGNKNTAFETFALEATPVSAYSTTEKYVETPVQVIGDRGGDFGCAAGDVPDRGWDIYYVDVVVPSKTVKLGAKVAYSGDGWFSFSNFSLVKIGEVTDAQRQAYSAAIYGGGLGDVENAEAYGSVIGEEKNVTLRNALETYDEDAIAAAIDLCKSAAPHYTAWDTYVAANRDHVNNVATDYSNADGQKLEAFPALFAIVPNSADEAKTALVNAQHADMALQISHKLLEGNSERGVINVANPNAELGIFDVDPNAGNARWTGDENVMQIGNQGLDFGADFLQFNKSFESKCADQASWNTNFTQTLDLPAGFYMLSCMMRGEGSLSKYRLAQKAGLTLPTDNTPTVNNYSNAVNPEYDGWKLVIIEFQMVKKGPATFGVQAEATAPNSKINFSNFRLSSGNSTVTGVESVSTEAAEAEYYDLNGYRVNPENLVPGLYIVRQGDKVTKVLVK